MSALTVGQDPDQNWDELVRYWEEMEWPEGSKVEIIEGIITVSPAPASRHNVIAARIQRRLYSVLPDDLEIFQTQAVEVPSRLGMLIPDLLVAPVQVCVEADSHIPAALAELVVEVTSKSNARHDRISKAAACATASIPLYLLIDRWAPGGPTATLYGEPKGDVYRVLSAVKFGDPITLPEPFGLTIDTGEFPVG
ncbi:Uma2 family endonuclease [Streptomyces sp. NPDC086777]|uniref:Uma2 family endonuclease n=1 Tax=Streptomyces sp. NPDC086777 TaxID=3154866 RepID=UPI00344D6844